MAVPVTEIVVERPADGAVPGAQALYRVFIHGLELACRVGVHAHEHDGPQRVRIDVDLWVCCGQIAIDDDITKVVSYEEVVSGIESLIGRGHVNLVETLAENIAQLCFTDVRVEKVRVRIEKLEVYAHARAVGVEIERRRDS